MNDRKAEIVKELIQDEMAAVETYRQLLQKTSHLPHAAELERVEGEHEKAVETLKKEYFGGDIPEGPGAWGTFASTVEGMAKVMGNDAAIEVLKGGEQQGIRDYERALSVDGINPEFRDLIRTILLPQTRAHVPVLDKLLRLV